MVDFIYFIEGSMCSHSGYVYYFKGEKLYGGTPY